MTGFMGLEKAARFTITPESTRIGEPVSERDWADRKAFEIVSKWLRDPITKPMRDAIRFEENEDRHPADPERMMFVVLGVNIREELRRTVEQERARVPGDVRD